MTDSTGHEAGLVLFTPIPTRKRIAVNAVVFVMYALLLVGMIMVGRDCLNSARWEWVELKKNVLRRWKS
jgi:hypothetical protein